MRPTPRLTLASRSPRRAELLSAAGYIFEVDPADIDEQDVPPGLAPEQLAAFLAEAKARWVAARHPDSIVLGADTVVAIGSVTYGKAETRDAARAMLAELAGRRQNVLTGVALFAPGQPSRVIVERSIIEMTGMSDSQLDQYISSDQWRDKAGAYGIQDHDQANDPIVRIVEGELSNAVGLPMNRVCELLHDAGITPTRGK